MATQTDPRIVKIIEGMVSAGVHRQQAVAVAMAIEHAMECPDFAAYYGTLLRDELTNFIDLVYTS